MSDKKYRFSAYRGPKFYLSLSLISILHFILFFSGKQTPKIDKTTLGSKKFHPISLRLHKNRIKTVSLRKKKKEKKKAQTSFYQNNKSIEKSPKWTPQNFQPTFSNSSPNGLSSKLEFETPRPFSKDEKSKLESELLSFYSRITNRISNSLSENYFDIKRINPLSRLPVNERKDLVSLRLTYDKDGNLMRVQTLKSAGVKIHNYFFHKSLGDVDFIPNPPERLLNKNKEFSMISTLFINYY